MSKAIFALIALSLFSLSSFAEEQACVGIKTTPSTARFSFKALGKEAYKENEGTEVPYRVVLSNAGKVLLDKVMTGYEFEGTIYFNGDQKEEGWVSLFNPENSGLDIPARKWKLLFDCHNLIHSPYEDDQN